MSLLTRIKTWLKPAAKPAQKHAQTHRAPISQPDPQPAPAREKPPLPPATGVVDTRVQVRVFYQNASSHVDLHAPITLLGHTGDPLPITWQVIAGFVLTEIKNFTQVFPASNQVIWCGYAARVAGPVIVYHRDTQGRLLQVPEMIQGVLNQPYTVKALSEFETQAQGLTSQSGMFTEGAQSLRFVYNLTTLEAGQMPEDSFIQLTAAKLAYPQPLAGEPYRDLLPAHTYWRVYAVLRDTANHTVWFNVGGNQWLTADDTKGVASNPYLPDPTPLALPHSLFTRDETPSNLHGTILGDATVWDEPFGKMSSTRLPEGTRVNVVAVVTLDNHSRWYRLADGHYVLATFITIEEAGHTPAQSAWQDLGY